MDAVTSTASSVAHPATNGAGRPFPWSRTQAVTLLTRFIVAAVATCGIATLIWLRPGSMPAWVALVPGVMLAGAEGAGISLCAVEWRDYGWRALSRGAEIWPALAAACLNTVAIFGAVVLIVYALIASGVYTVALTRGTVTDKIRGETPRRLVVALANAGFIALVICRSQGWDPKVALGVDELTLVWVCVSLTVLASVRAAVDIALWARSGG